MVLVGIALVLVAVLWAALRVGSDADDQMEEEDAYRQIASGR